MLDLNKTPRVTQVENPELRSWAFQAKLEKMWQILESDEEIWRMTETNEQVCVLDWETMDEVFSRNWVDAREAFDTYDEHNPETLRYEWHNRPEELIGTYTIKGQYTISGRFLPNAVVGYYFSEGF